MTIGEKVKLYRDTHGESQRQFAIRAGVSNTTINYLEKGVNPNTGKAFAPDTETIAKFVAKSSDGTIMTTVLTAQQNIPYKL